MTTMWIVLGLPVLACSGNNTELAEPADSGLPSDSGGSDDVWGQAALDYVTENLVGTYQGAWVMSGLDSADSAVEFYTWTDDITASNPRIDNDRALVDILDVMDGGNWTSEVSFHEGVYIAEDGSVGDYFIEMDGEVTIMTETSPDVWEYDAEVTNTDYNMMENVSAENVIAAWKHAVKLVSTVDGLERHDVTTTTHVEYDAGAGAQTVEFVSMEGYHQAVE